MTLAPPLPPPQVLPPTLPSKYAGGNTWRLHDPRLKDASLRSMLKGGSSKPAAGDNLAQQKRQLQQTQLRRERQARREEERQARSRKRGGKKKGTWGSPPPLPSYSKVGAHLGQLL